MHRVILNRLTVVVTILCVPSMLNLAAAAQVPYEVGQYWEYSLEGPRPGAMEPKAIDGKKILYVLETIGNGSEQQWIIEERFTNDPNVIACLRVGPDRKLTTIVFENEKGESLTLTYDAAFPYQYIDIKPGESMRIETAVVTEPGGFKLPSSVEFTRLDDETLDTPAGRFADCRVYRSVTNSVFDIKIAKIPVKEQRQWWYSDRVGAVVKEVYTRDPVKFLTWSKDSYTSTSTLTAFGVRGVSENQQAAANRDGTLAAVSPANVQTQRNWKWPAVAVCVATAFIALRRFTRSRKLRQSS